MNKIFISLLTALTLIPVGVLEAHAEEETTEIKNHLEPKYSFDSPKAGTLLIHAEKSLPYVSFCVTQTTPEREELVLYDFQCGDYTTYEMDLESGDYTLTVRFNTLDDGVRISTFSKDFSIANPDFTDEYSFTTIDFTYQRLDGGDTLGHEGDEDSTISEGMKTTYYNYTSYVFKGKTGDLNQDGAVDASDATAALKKYVSMIMGKEKNESFDELLYGDINSDNRITADDATLILKYYVKSLSSTAPSWKELIK